MKTMTKKIQTNVQIGKQFEKETISALKKINFKIRQTKSSYDRGIDFHGKWDNLENCNIVGQCKCEKKPLGEKYIRELEGTLSHHEDENKKNSSIGILVSSTGYSNYALNYHRNSKYSIILAIVKQGEINFFLFNEILKKKFPNLKIGYTYRPQKEIYFFNETKN